MFKSLETLSTFSKVPVDFATPGCGVRIPCGPTSSRTRDRSPTPLAYYVATIPPTLASGFWNDTIKAWNADDAYWGSPYPTVSITVDNDRRYQGRRVIRFRRAAGAGEAGIRVRQWTNSCPWSWPGSGCDLQTHRQ